MDGLAELEVTFTQNEVQDLDKDGRDALAMSVLAGGLMQYAKVEEADDVERGRIYRYRVKLITYG